MKTRVAILGLFLAALVTPLATPRLAAAEQSSNGTGHGMTTACAAHARNHGKSYGYGLGCATTTLTYTETCTGGSATQTYAGSGLLPGSAVYISYTTGVVAGQTYYLGSADLTGAFSYSAQGLILFPSSFYLSGIGANGQQFSTQTYTQIACP